MKDLAKKTKLEFKLKQHTPIIHFQHDQEGATLRATEVKAKLDKYIWKQAWMNDFSKGKAFLVGYSPAKSADLERRFKEDQFRALDYKIQFWAHDKQAKPIHERMRLFFGNMGSDDDSKKEKYFVESKGGVSGTIFCDDPDLIEILRKHLYNFFQRENFGTRQNKGFGSFQITEIDGSQPSFVNPSSYVFKITINAELDTLWEHIDLFYKTLRSGINMKLDRGATDKLYFKSLLFQYAKKKNHQWDKRKIRLDLFRNHPKFQEVERKRTDKDGTVQYSNGTPMLYRDMLGLSSSQDWLSYRATVTKDSVTGSIERYKSPITFKPFRQTNGWEVYIIPGEIPSEMKNAGFKIEAGSKSTILSTPDFDLGDYLKFAFSYFNDDRTLEDYVGDHLAPREVKILSNIYEQLSNQI